MSAIEWATEIPAFGADGRVTWRPMPAGWRGVVARDQAEADAAVPALVAGPAAVRLVVAVPLRGPIDPTRLVVPRVYGSYLFDCLTGKGRTYRGEPFTEELAIDAVVVGGGDEPCHPAWLRAIRDQCAAAGVAFAFTGWGSWWPACRPLDADEVAWASNSYPAGRWIEPDGSGVHRTWECVRVARVGAARSGRVLDGRTHEELPAIEGEVAP